MNINSEMYVYKIHIFIEKLYFFYLQCRVSVYVGRVAQSV